MDGRTEFIGENVTISHHSDSSLCGVSGMIVDETRETIVIESSQPVCLPIQFLLDKKLFLRSCYGFN